MVQFGSFVVSFNLFSFRHNVSQGLGEQVPLLSVVFGRQLRVVVHRLRSEVRGPSPLAAPGGAAAGGELPHGSVGCRMWRRRRWRQKEGFPAPPAAGQGGAHVLRRRAGSALRAALWAETLDVQILVDRQAGRQAGRQTRQTDERTDGRTDGQTYTDMIQLYVSIYCMWICTKHHTLCFIVSIVGAVRVHYSLQ